MDNYKDSLFICLRVHPTPLEIWFIAKNSPRTHSTSYSWWCDDLMLPIQTSVVSLSKLGAKAYTLFSYKTDSGQRQLALLPWIGSGRSNHLQEHFRYAVGYIWEAVHSFHKYKGTLWSLKPAFVFQILNLDSSK